MSPHSSPCPLPSKRARAACGQPSVTKCRQQSKSNQRGTVSSIFLPLSPLQNNLHLGRRTWGQETKEELTRGLLRLRKMTRICILSCCLLVGHRDSKADLPKRFHIQIIKKGETVNVMDPEYLPQGQETTSLEQAFPPRARTSVRWEMSSAQELG